MEIFLQSGKPFSEFPDYILYELNEGILTRVVGGLTGLALGKTIGRFLVKIFEINEDSVLYKIFTSRLFYMAIGAAFGRETGGGSKKVID